MADEARTRDTIYVVYIPYLPLRRRADVGAWHLIPRGGFRDDDAIDEHVARLARGFADLHELPRGASTNVGVFAHLRDAKIGDDPDDRDLIVDLHRALVVGVLDVNESPLLPDDEKDPNVGHRTMTSDNAIVVANGISRDGGWTPNVSGGRVRHLELGISVLSDDEMPDFAKIMPPGDLRVPPWPNPIDTGYADAAWESIRRDTEAARRLARAIDWLDLAWRNAAAIADDLRVPALRAGFEVLLDSDDTAALRRRLSNLLDPDDAPTDVRRWRNRRGNEQAEEMTDVAWWFIRFSLLRNDLMHGRLPTADAWRHEGRSHVDLGEWWLRQAIKETVARDGHDDIREEMRWREALHAAAEFAKQNRIVESDDHR